MTSKSINKYLRIGPGGVKCPCCGPPPGRERRSFFRIGRRREEKAAFKVEQSESGEGHAIKRGKADKESGSGT